ncbi:GNAT family N-acetyltransferase [Jiella marina]|uniref:GNAT family N-acetyltransferase n=1 Tax=Jiella sp. LLJ827 TaxID=2917712 RepID=UPI002100753E|nr:N-acetyltransferase [Jiella sp. LLJ827]MCQ0989680.1 N-acetyltransferase [Jiella sp. LLJ827]
MTSLADVRLLPEHADHDLAIAEIAEEAFGPGRFARAAERVREMAPHDRSLSFVAELGGTIIASVRLTPIRVGEVDCLFLGPLAVRPAYKNKGVGKALMRLCAETARERGETTILLVGDPPYYAPLGYRPIPPGDVTLPGPVDQRRLLILDLIGSAGKSLSGAVTARPVATEARSSG